MAPSKKPTPLEAIQLLTSVGKALSAEKDHSRLMELILHTAKDLTLADGGTLYSRSDDDRLEFEIMLNDSLGLCQGGTSGRPVAYAALPLYDEDGRPNERMVAARAVITGATVNIPDAYDARDFDFSGTRDFDARTGYRSKSFLTVPMRNHEDEIIGVLQLLNARHVDTGDVVAFTLEDQRLVESLASQAAITLTKRRLIDEHQRLFEAFVELIASAIDDKSPYTGSHCRRVPELTMMLADAAAATQGGALGDFTMSDDDRYELRIASWLHDCGKVATPEWLIDKATKLTALYDRIDVIDTRFAVMARDAEIARLRGELEARDQGEAVDRAALDEEYRKTLRRLDAARRFLHDCNQGGEFMSAERQDEVRRIGSTVWVDAGGTARTLLDRDEIHNLNIPRGTLNPKERAVINKHADTTIKMLESLPYPKHLTRVPEFAAGHHEHMDGSGYPRGLTREEMSVQARAMGIADVFEALTANDRPYKGAMALSQALTTLGHMKLDNHIDPDLFDVFIREKVYLEYAEAYLSPELIDEVDLHRIPGVPEDVLAAEREPLKKAG